MTRGTKIGMGAVTRSTTHLTVKGRINIKHIQSQRVWCVRMSQCVSLERGSKVDHLTCHLIKSQVKANILYDVMKL